LEVEAANDYLNALIIVDIDRRWTQINADEINPICVHQRLSAVKTCGCGFAASGLSAPTCLRHRLCRVLAETEFIGVRG
jgi:hypothetical protein